jgi:hypothetical protein
MSPTRQGIGLDCIIQGSAAASTCGRRHPGQWERIDLAPPPRAAAGDGGLAPRQAQASAAPYTSTTTVTPWALRHLHAVTQPTRTGKPGDDRASTGFDVVSLCGRRAAVPVVEERDVSTLWEKPWDREVGCSPALASFLRRVGLREGSLGPPRPCCSVPLRGEERSGQRAGGDGFLEQKPLSAQRQAGTGDLFGPPPLCDGVSGGRPRACGRRPGPWPRPDPYRRPTGGNTGALCLPAARAGGLPGGSVSPGLPQVEGDSGCRALTAAEVPELPPGWIGDGGHWSGGRGSCLRCLGTVSPPGTGAGGKRIRDGPA